MLRRKRTIENLLTKDEFLKLGQELKCEYVPVPELKEGGVIKIRELSGQDRDDLEKMLSTKADGSISVEGIRSKTLSLCIINEDGTLMFNKEEIQELGRFSGKVLMRLYAKASDLSGLGQKELDKIVKNSEPQDLNVVSSSD
jgi:hypothetical protein